MKQKMKLVVVLSLLVFGSVCGAFAMLPLAPEETAVEAPLNASPEQFFDAAHFSPRELAALQEVDSVIIVFKESATVRKKDGKSAAEKAEFKSIKNLKKSVAHSLKKSGKSKKGGSSPSRAARNLKNMYSAKLAEGSGVFDAMEEIRNSGLVEYVEPDYKVYPLAVPNDTYFDEVWALNNTGQPYYDRYQDLTSGTPGADINWLAAWEGGNFPTNEIIVCVIDTGVDYTHPDLVNRMWHNPGEAGVLATNGVDDDENGYIDDVYGIDALNGDADPWDDHFHGTHCAGTIAAEGNNNFGITGINPYAKIMACKFLGESGGSSFGAIDSIYYAVEMGAKVLNNSWGGGVYLQSLQDAITYANEQGVWFLAAAGNDGKLLNKYPASYLGVTSVAATTSDDEKVYFSNWGSTVDVMAPGHDILSLAASGGLLQAYGAAGKYMHPVDTNLATVSGTSMACPVAAGLASLLVSSQPGHDPFLYEQVMKAACDTHVFSMGDNTNYPGLLGAGRIDTDATLNYSGTNAFMHAYLMQGNSADINAAPGDVLDMYVILSAWATPVSNLTVQITAIDTNLSLNTTSLSMGAVAAYGSVKFTNDFAVTLKESCEFGREYDFTVQLKQNGVLVHEETVSVPVYGALLSDFVVYDVEGDGYKEIASADFYGQLYGLDYKGNVNWVSAMDMAPGSAIYDYLPGDWNGDGTQTLAVAIAYGIFGGQSELYKLDANGNVVENRDLSERYHDLTVVDLDGDGKDELITKSSSYTTEEFGNRSRIEIYNMESFYVQKTLYTRPGPYVFEKIAVGDVDGDGLPEIVTADRPWSVSIDDIMADPYTTIVKVFDGSGNLLRSRELEEPIVISGPLVLGDMDGDGTKDILFVQSEDTYTDSDYYSAVTPFPQHHIMEGLTLESFEGWPRPLDLTDFVIGDIDNDGDLEIVGMEHANNGAVFAGFLRAYHHDGSAVAGYPYYETDLKGGSLVLSDVDADGYADMVYLGNVYTNEAKPNFTYYTLKARDHQGLMLQGFPKTIEQYNEYFSLLVWHALAVEEMAPGFEEGEPGTAQIVSSIYRGVQVDDMGVQFFPHANEWSSLRHDNRSTYCHTHTTPDFEVRIASPVRVGYGSLNATFYATIYGDDQEGVGLQWDFNDDGTSDQTGTNRAVSFNYTNEGIYAVSVTVTNAVGATHTVTLPDYITVYPASGVEAAFSATPRSGLAPLRVHFTDQSLYAPDGWAWEVDPPSGGWTTFSSAQNPWLDMTEAGTYHIRLTASNSVGGSSDTATSNSMITITGTFPGMVTNHYVSLSGSHAYPFKTWAEASTNIHEALEAAGDGHHVIVTNGTYIRNHFAPFPIGKVLAKNVTLRSVNGPGVTILDGEDKRPGIYNVYDNFVLSGFSFRKTQGGSKAGSAVFSATDTFNGYGMGESSSVISNCWFVDNAPRKARVVFAPAGNVIYIGGQSNDTSLIVDCIFERNTPNVKTGLIYSPLQQKNWVTVDRCIFRNNRSAFEELITTSINVQNSLFYNNDVVSILNEAYNCTLADNTVSDTALKITQFLEDGPVGGRAKNSILYNAANNYGPIDPTHAPDQFMHNDWSPISGAPGCIDTDPVFANPAMGDYRLMSNSPCVDAGSNWWTYVPTLTKTAKIDFGTIPSGSDWNNITNLSAGSKILDMTVTNGSASGWSISFTEAFDFFKNDGFLHDGVTYPSSAYSDGIGVIAGQSNQVVISGLNTSATYDLTFHNSSTSLTELISFRIEEKVDSGGLWIRVSCDPDRASQGPGTKSSLSPDASGRLHIWVTESGAPGLADMLWNTLEIREYGWPPTDQPLTNWMDLAGTNRIMNGTPDIGAYEYTGHLTPVAVPEWVESEDRAGYLVQFTGTNSYDPDGSITTYDWDFGDGSVSSNAGPNVSHVYASAGYRRITLTVTDNTGLTGEGTVELTVRSAVPNAPTNLQGTNDAPLEVNLGWQDNASDEDGFRVERMTHAYPPIDVIIDDTDSRVWYIDFLDGDWVTNVPTPSSNAWNGSYHYAAFNTDKSHSTAHAYCFPELPEGVYEFYMWWPNNSNLPGEGDLSKAISLKVTHEERTETLTPNIRINGGQWNLMGIYPMNAQSHILLSNWEGGDGYLAMDAFRFKKIEEFDVIGHVGENVTNFTDTASNGVTDGRTYHYRVAATNELGESDYSNEIIVSIAYTNQPPVAEILSVTQTNGVVDLPVTVTGRGIDSDGTITNYVWDFGDGYSGSRQQGASLTNAFYSYRNIGTHTLTFKVYDDQGFVSTNTAEVIIHADGSSPAEPANLLATPNGESTIDLSWEDVFNEDGFEIERKTAGAFSPRGTAGQNMEAYADSVMPGVSYTYRVRATNEFGASDWSNEATTNTTDATPPVLSSASASTDVTVIISFSEEVDQTTAETAGNYTLDNGGIVQSAVLDESNHSKVILTVFPLTREQFYTVTVNNVEDLYDNPVAADSETIFQYQIWVRILFDCGQPNHPTAGNWNNFTAQSAGSILTNAVDETGAGTGVGLELLTDVTGLQNNNVFSPSGLYPDSAMYDCFAGYGDADQIRLSGLGTGITYTVTFFASRYETDPVLTTYTIGSSNVTLDAARNTNQTIQILAAPDAVGEMTVSFDASSGAAILSVLELNYPLPVESPELQTTVTELSVPEGSTNAFGIKLSAQPEAETTVSVAFVSGDADLSVQDGSNLVFTTNNWMSYQPVTLAAAPDGDWADSNALFRCSSPGMADLHITAVEDDAETNPDYALPWSEPFEALLLGALDGQHGWTSSGAIVTNADAQGGSQSLSITEAMASHSFDGAPTNVWIEFWGQPVRSDEPATISSNASAVFYVNTNDQIVAYSNTTPLTLSGTVVSNGWNKFGIECDYVSKVWKLELNDELVVSNFAFYGNLASFSKIEIKSIAAGTAFLDSINVSDSSDESDSDGDGLPDDWETLYYGDLSPDPLDSASNGVNSVWESYIIGLDPTNPTNRFELSNLRNMVQWSSVSGRVYTIYWTSNLLNGFFQTLETNLPWTPAIFTDTTHAAEQKGFYKIEVELE